MFLFVVSCVCVFVVGGGGGGVGHRSGQVCQWAWDRTGIVALASPQGNYSERTHAHIVGCWCQALWDEAMRASDLLGSQYVVRDGRAVNPTTREPGNVEATVHRN